MNRFVKRAAAAALALAVIALLIPSARADSFGSVSDADGNLAVSSTDAAGKAVPAAFGNRDEAIVLRIPLKSVGSTITYIKLSPIVSTDLDSFPFVMDRVDYTQESTGRFSGVLSGNTVWEFGYTMTLAHKVTAGNKQVMFDVQYKTDDGVMHSAQLAVFVNVIRGASMGGGGGGGTTYYPTPKVIISSYSISADPVYAGESFTLSLTVTNTSTDEAVRNLAIAFADESGNVLPADNGSNSLYIEKMDMGESVTCEIGFQSAPDTEPKAYTLDVTFSYDGVKSKQAYTPTSAITIPVLQRIRVKIDNPIVYDDAWVGNECAMYIALFNMGKATIYNCMVDVEGEGLRLSETFFGGNIQAGSTMRADFYIIPSVGGNIDAHIVISYEDVYGVQTVERIPFQLFVNESYTEGEDGSLVWGEDGEGGVIRVETSEVGPAADGMGTDAAMTDGAPASGFPWLYVGGGAGAAAVIATVVTLSIRKRKRAEAEL